MDQNLRKLIEKKQETNQQTENKPKICRNRSRTCNMRKPIKKTENESDVNISEMDQKYLDIPQNFSVFEGFLKKKETDQKSLFGPFPCWSVSVLRRFHSTTCK